ncbi:helix-turn-helix domain-containing protein [Streptococcus uberis]|uniref:helix-turn-helix domain-containing protein n=1 Tax=Streptococcus uberis TaxID=1349 RepID=UPI001FF2EDD5|nr:helix-turn-helix domain-containing protein [Streptococcus uberis]MCK1222309.1 helix-turn-helix domain-containing protein [Streptococcus uberis]
MREQTLGEFLRETRVQRKITLDDIESQTGISSHYLLALELDQFKIIPENNFENILKQYAEFVGLDYGLLKNRYEEQVDSNNSANINSVTKQVEEKLYQRRQNNQSFVLPSKTHDTTPNNQIDSSEDVTPIPEISSSQIKIEEKQELESLVVNDRDKREISRLSRYQLEEKKSKSILSVLLLSLLALAVFTFIFFAVWKQFSTEHRIDNITSIFTKKSSDASKAKGTVPTETTQTSSSEKQTIITSQGQDNYLNATVTKAKDTVEVTVTLTDAESLWFSLTNSDIGEAGMTLTKENPTYTTTLSADVAESIITLGMPHGVEIKIDNQPLDLTPLTSSDISYITLSIQQ